MSGPAGAAPGQQWMSVAQALNVVERYRQAGQLSAAADLCRQLLSAQPNHPDVLHVLGIVAHQGGDAAAAIDLIKKAIKANGNVPLYHSNLGEISRQAGRLEEAVSAGRRAVELQPNYPQALNNLGIAYYDQEKYEEAAECYRRAIAQDPNFAEAHSNLGNALRARHKLDEAIAAYNRAIQLKPAYADAIANYASVLHLGGRIDDAIATYKRALALDPVQANAHSGIGLLWLTKGDYENGWFGYEWRLRCAETRYRPPPGPMWEGDDLGGRRILITAEQGYGDAIQFCRYLPMVRDRGGTVVFPAPAAVRSLIACSMPWAEVPIAAGQRLPVYDCHCPLLSLPQRMQTRPETIPSAVPYLRASPEALARWRERIGQGPELKVGLVWAGNPKQLNDINRSMPSEALLPLIAVDGVRFFSLQVGYRAGELTQMSNGRVVDLAPSLTDFMETAGAVGNLDLVLTVCTSVAHLVGGMAKPMWVALSWNPDWRWGSNREDCAWYPTARLFRQRRRREWGSVVESLAAELRAVVGGDRGRLAPFAVKAAE
jgi:tetratricopeptide (TPR) repeat protein